MLAELWVHPVSLPICAQQIAFLPFPTQVAGLGGAISPEGTGGSWEWWWVGMALAPHTSG